MDAPRVQIDQTLLRKMRGLPDDALRDAIRTARRQLRREQRALQYLRQLGPEPLYLTISILENNPFGIKIPAHHRPQRIPGALEHDASDDPMQFGNTVPIPKEFRDSGVGVLWIVNITATFFTGVKFNLKLHAYMNRRWPGHHNTSRFCTLTTKKLSGTRLTPCTASCKAYNSGLISLTNTRSPQEALLNAHLYVQMLQGAGIFDARVLNFKIDNIVAASDFGTRLRLQCMVRSVANPSVMDYDPETFPAAIYREKTAAAPDGCDPLPDRRVAVLIFASGKIIYVGFRNIEQLTNVHVKINNLAQSFICDANDMANASGGMHLQQEQQMADVDRLMYELICINAPDKAAALLTQAPQPRFDTLTGGGGGIDGGTNNDNFNTAEDNSMISTTSGHDDFMQNAATRQFENDRYVPYAPLMGQLSHAGVQELYDAVNELSNSMHSSSNYQSNSSVQMMLN